MIAKTPASVMVVVDSYGAMYAEQVELLVKKYQAFGQADAARKSASTPTTTSSWRSPTRLRRSSTGRIYMDASMAGLGRGAGNCPTELLVGFLRNPKFHIRPIYQAIQERLLPLSRTVEWGPFVQYNITGQLNEHPHDAMAARAATAATTTSISTTG